MVVGLTLTPGVAHLDENNLQLDVKLSATLGLTAEQAKQKLNRFLIDEVSLLIHAQDPLLVVVDRQTIYWRFSLVFSLGPRGRLGQVGEIDIDARSGELLINEELLAEIKTHARILAESTTPAPNH